MKVLPFWGQITLLVLLMTLIMVIPLQTVEASAWDTFKETGSDLLEKTKEKYQELYEQRKEEVSQIYQAIRDNASELTTQFKDTQDHWAENQFLSLQK